MKPWERWEDWRAGLYLQRPEELELSRQARALLCDPDQFREAAREMLREWPAAAEHNLMNMWSGRRSWVGQATCCYSLGATAADTRDAWGLMSNPQQRLANAVADQVIAEWRKETQDAQTLFGH